MSNLIKRELKKIMDLSDSMGEPMSEETAFDFLICSIYCYNTLDYEKKWYEISNENITDGANDGGIDFVFYDDENSKVIIGQNKYSSLIDVNAATAEIEKINHTIQSFMKNSTVNYSKNLKQRLLNVMDRLNEENEGNIDIIFTSLSSFDQKKVIERVEGNSLYSDLTFMSTVEIERIIQDLQTELNVVSEFQFNLDRTRNELYYSSDNYEGIVLNISASSLKSAFDRFESEGLFNLNIRRYIKSKNVDDAIISSINKDKDDFWFKNNGLTIACKDFKVDGNNVKIYDFSIVNGGQTTTLIAKNFKSNSEDFFVMTKIIKSIESLDNSDSMSFFNEIAEATNSQKPIQPRDLKSNAPEMLQLQRLFEDKGVFLEIKRGITAPRKYNNKKIKNDDLAQIFFSFVLQRPGPARSNKRSLFSNNSNYKQIFYRKYAKNPNKIEFLIDLVKLFKRIEIIIQKFKNNENSTPMSLEQLNVLNNGKLAIIALMGFIYRIVNNDYDIRVVDLEIELDNFEYGNFISNYKEDDIDKLLTDLVFELTAHITDLYIDQFNSGKVTSISNFLKTDKKYQEVILDKYIVELKKRDNLKSLIGYYGNLFKRK